MAAATGACDVVQTLLAAHATPVRVGEGWHGFALAYRITYMKTIKKHTHVGKYTSHMDPMGLINYSSYLEFVHFADSHVRFLDCLWSNFQGIC